MTPEQALFAAILTCIAGALLTLCVARSRELAGWINFAVTASSAALIFFAVESVLTKGPSTNAATFWLVVRLHVDGLTAVFLFLAAFIAVPAALYSIAYMRRYAGFSVARYYPWFLLFLAAMYGLLSTTDMMWFFFIFWQLMTLPGWSLIRFDNIDAANRHAANKFLAMMQIACLSTMAGAFMVGGGLHGNYDFGSVRARLPALLASNPGWVTVAFALFLVGFGIKMGMWPFGQFWLPDAHPAAPSPISAMLSGVMIKTGVYGVIRYFLWLTPTGVDSGFSQSTWGVAVALLGTVTLFTGTMQALAQEQTKRLLAFHSIGQVGYILLGVGACMALVGPAPAIAALALFAALFHTLNHGVFKALLFFNAGSMLCATDTQDLNKMGGLLKFMPWTGITALVASLSISGVPLFNGFASKWSLYVALVDGSGFAPCLVFCAAISILTSALTLASFIKFFGAAFLSRSSALVKTRAAQRGSLEVGWLMQAPQLFLASVCVLLGLVPGLALRLIGRAFEVSPGRNVGVPLFDSSHAVFAPEALLLVMGLCFLGVFALTRIGCRSRRAATPWLCGEAREEECNRYKAHNFYGDFKRHFRWLGGIGKS